MANLKDLVLYSALMLGIASYNNAYAVKIYNDQVVASNISYLASSSADISVGNASPEGLGSVMKKGGKLDKNSKDPKSNKPNAKRAKGKDIVDPKLKPKLQDLDSIVASGKSEKTEKGAKPYRLTIEKKVDGKSGDYTATTKAEIEGKHPVVGKRLTQSEYDLASKGNVQSSIKKFGRILDENEFNDNTTGNSKANEGSKGKAYGLGSRFSDDSLYDDYQGKVTKGVKIRQISEKKYNSDDVKGKVVAKYTGPSSTIPKGTEYRNNLINPSASVINTTGVSKVGGKEVVGGKEGYSRGLIGQSAKSSTEGYSKMPFGKK